MSKAVCQKLWHQMCMIRDKYRCVLCDDYAWPHVHHIIKKSEGNARHQINIYNGIVLCGAKKTYNCHDKVHKHGRQWLIDRLPTRLPSKRFEAILALDRASHEVCREKLDYKAIKAELKTELVTQTELYEAELDSDIQPDRR